MKQWHSLCLITQSQFSSSRSAGTCFAHYYPHPVFLPDRKNIHAPVIRIIHIVSGHII
jgi:hypothetical protein